MWMTGFGLSSYLVSLPLLCIDDRENTENVYIKNWNISMQSDYFFVMPGAITVKNKHTLLQNNIIWLPRTLFENNCSRLAHSKTDTFFSVEEDPKTWPKKINHPNIKKQKSFIICYKQTMRWFKNNQ